MKDDFGLSNYTVGIPNWHPEFGKDPEIISKPSLDDDSWVIKDEKYLFIPTLDVYVLDKDPNSIVLHGTAFVE